ncbi:MAG: lipocalin family protein, partial [Acidobacteriota bacterium]
MPAPLRLQEDGRVRAVAELDLQRYAGLWYEIARFPNRFQKDCVGEVTADYRLR